MGRELTTDDRLAHRLLGHDTWATALLLQRCRDLTPAQFSKRFDIGPGSLHDTLLHVVGCVHRWTDRIGDRPLRSSVEKEQRTWTPDEILSLLHESEPEFKAVVTNVIREGRLDETMEFSAPDLQEPIVFTRGTAIVHVITHGVHHRAQALNMLRRLGVADLPDLDAVDWELAERPDVSEPL